MTTNINILFSDVHLKDEIFNFRLNFLINVLKSVKYLQLFYTVLNRLFRHGSLCSKKIFDEA